MEEKKHQLKVVAPFILNNPKNKRRRRNKIILENESFELVFDTKLDDIVVAKKDDLYFSIIPYDTSRKYIEMASLMSIENPIFLDEYIQKHKENLNTYIKLALFQVTGNRYEDNSPEIVSQFAFIESDVYFKIQVVGRLLQHDETGPLSATLPYKFLYDFNLKTGIHGYIKEWLAFLNQTTQEVPLVLQENVYLLVEDTNQSKLLFPKESTALMLSNQINGLTLRKSELTKEQVQELMTIRKDYKPQSKHPSEIQQYFDVVHSNRTENKINVVSDIHSRFTELPFDSPNFNILAGDLVDAQTDELVFEEKIRGIAVIGNHDIVQCAKALGDAFSIELLGALTNTTDIDYSVLRADDKGLYQQCQSYLEKVYPNVTFLNNESHIYEGVRYIGLTLPVNYVKEKHLVQSLLVKTLTLLLKDDKEIPTVIISHSPLFNELSLLSPKSSRYKKDFICVNQELKSLFNEYHILGVIHGHHHIPASSGVVEFREFAGKELFILCSIYSTINKGFDLEPVLRQLINKNKVKG